MDEPKPLESVVTPVPTDIEAPKLYAVAIYGLIAAGLIALLSLPILAVLQREIPDSIATLGAVALGALAGMLTPRSP